MTRRRIGLQIGATTAPNQLTAVVEEAEQLGYSEIWLAEDYFELGGVASVTAALSSTERVPIGLGVVAAGARHPAVAAMEFATLGALFPDRFMAGIGHGVAGWLRQMGLEPTSPMKQLREAATSVRELLRGEQLSTDGEYFRFDRIRLEHPPREPVPLYLGVHGPKSLRLSGELADGTLLGWFSTPSYVSWARDQIEVGRARSERSDPHELVVLCVLSISEDDPIKAGREVVDWASPMLSAMTKSPQLRFSETGAELSTLLAGGQDPGDNQRRDDIVMRYVAAGDLDSCLEAVQGLLDAGADRVVLVPNPAGFRSTPDMVAQMRMAARLIGPVTTTS